MAHFPSYQKSRLPLTPVCAHLEPSPSLSQRVVSVVLWFHDVNDSFVYDRKRGVLWFHDVKESFVYDRKKGAPSFKTPEDKL